MCLNKDEEGHASEPFTDGMPAKNYDFAVLDDAFEHFFIESQYVLISNANFSVSLKEVEQSVLGGSICV